MSTLNVKHAVIPYGRQSIDAADIAAVTRVLRGDWLTQGPAVNEFERALCKKVGAPYAAAVANGTAALHLACLAAGIGQGDEVILPALTFAATANAVLYCGGKPVFADIDPANGNIDPDEVKRCITSRTKMIIAVHYAGFPADMPALKGIVRSHGLLLLEDAAHALGAVEGGVPVGSCRYSDMAVFSFHPLKHITTAEGGVVMSNHRRWHDRVMLLRTHGITKDKELFNDQRQGEWYHEMQSLGFNYRLSDVQCALGVSQLKRLSFFISARRRIAKKYDQAFKGHPFLKIVVPQPGTKAAYHLYPIRLRGTAAAKRRFVFDELRKAGVGVQVHYIPVYRHPYYQALGYHAGLNPNAEEFYEREISLPIFPLMSQADVARVMMRVNQVLDKVSHG